MMLADVIMTAAEKAGGEPFTLGWLIAQPEVQRVRANEARLLSELREMVLRGEAREVSRHPVHRFAMVSGDCQ